MRRDIHKVLVESPRVAHFQSWVNAVGLNRKRNAYREAKHFQLSTDLEVCDLYCANKLPMKSRRLGCKVKMFGENLNPLWRFLKSRVGKKWDDVYSEIRSTLSIRSTVQNHVFQHLVFDVCTKTIRTENGRVMRWDQFHDYCDYEGNFYVDPESGELMIGTHQRS
jgi:hypothetical protein